MRELSPVCADSHCFASCARPAPRDCVSQITIRQPTLRSVRLRKSEVCCDSPCLIERRRRDRQLGLPAHGWRHQLEEEQDVEPSTATRSVPSISVPSVRVTTTFAVPAVTQPSTKDIPPVAPTVTIDDPVGQPSTWMTLLRGVGSYNGPPRRSDTVAKTKHDKTAEKLAKKEGSYVR